MKAFSFKGLFTGTHWISPAYVHIDTNGKIASIATKPSTEIQYDQVKGLAIPTFINAHSHAFQYAMAGLTESHRVGGNDDFWTWRKKMYQIALSIEPDDLYHIARMLYSEMLRHGYSHVVEFHYLHHDLNGTCYNSFSELGQRLIAAALDVGIKMTLVPMLYQQGGFNMNPEPEQRRFISSLDIYFAICEELIRESSLQANTYFGYGAHSLRAVNKENIACILDTFGSKYPFHLHISEQLKEVEDAINVLGARPVEWLLNNFEVQEHFNLVHATHLTTTEVRRLAESKANVILCPSTEGNLGDGIFNFQDYCVKEGRWCIGTDSHIGLNPFEELRLLDYGQRLITHKRKTFEGAYISMGQNALKSVYINGKSAAGDPKDNILTEGSPFDAIVLTSEHPLLEGSSGYWLDTIIYHFTTSEMVGTIVNGKWVINEGYHEQIISIRENFLKTLNKLKIRNQ